MSLSLKKGNFFSSPLSLNNETKTKSCFFVEYTIFFFFKIEYFSSSSKYFLKFFFSSSSNLFAD
jgi:hypothetical protein